MGAEDPRHSGGQHFSAAGLGQELAQHGSQGDDSGCPRQCGSQAISEGLHHPKHSVGGRLAFRRGEDLTGGVADRHVQQQYGSQADNQRRHEQR